MKGKLGVTLTALLLTAAGLQAQGDRGIITGIVKDASGAVLAGAQVTAVHLDTNTNLRTTTTASGDFTVADLPVGNYQVRVESDWVQDLRRQQHRGCSRRDRAPGSGDGTGRHATNRRSYSQRSVAAVRDGSCVYRGIERTGERSAHSCKRRRAQPVRFGT